MRLYVQEPCLLMERVAQSNAQADRSSDMGLHITCAHKDFRPAGRGTDPPRTFPLLTPPARAPGRVECTGLSAFHAVFFVHSLVASPFKFCKNPHMLPIRAIGFDLFNTLVTVDSSSLKLADTLLLHSLRESGFRLDEEEFRSVYREEAGTRIKEAQLSGVETHNRFWIQAALCRQGHELDPFDSRIGAAVEAYFESFYESTRLIPGTAELLTRLRSRYRLGLLSNFTHGPACRRIIARTGLSSLFDVILISGELGYRKPSPVVFQRLLEELGAEGEHTLYIGDDPQPDIEGAIQAGIRPVWTTYVMDNRLPHAPAILSRDGSVPDAEVPRISDWGDLSRLLGLEVDSGAQGS